MERNVHSRFRYGFSSISFRQPGPHAVSLVERDAVGIARIDDWTSCTDKLGRAFTLGLLAATLGPIAVEQVSKASTVCIRLPLPLFDLWYK